MGKFAGKASRVEDTRTFIDQVQEACQRATQALLQMQHPDGYWWAELESNVTITAEYLMLHRLFGLPQDKFPGMVADLLDRQLDDGGWPLWYGGGGEISTTVEAYLALKLAGLPAADPRLVQARDFILARGGALKTRVFTRIFLALFGQMSWTGIPLLPVELILLPPWAGFSIYEFSSWTRATVVPLMITMAHRPVCPIPPEQGVAELFLDPSEPFEKHRVTWIPEGGLLENFFILLDRAFKLYHRRPLPGLRGLALRRAETWILQHQEDSGDWGGIQPAMLNSLLALHCLGYRPDHPVIRKGLDALEFFTLTDGRRLWLHSCISPVWDTALALRALMAAGGSQDLPAVKKTVQWLVDNQIHLPGDWCIKRPNLTPGGWAFEFVNNWYPDIDDSAVVLMALQEATPESRRPRDSMRLGFDWCLGMQCKNGGFAAFDVDNTKEWLNKIPFGDLKALVDPPTEDVTGRVLEMMGALGYGLDDSRAARALTFLKKKQFPDGPWWGRWGVNFIYGTWSVLMGLKAIGEDMRQPYVRRALSWLKAHQNEDGGWGEICETYRYAELRGQGPSTASQTAWALMGLIVAGEAASPEVQKGVAHLVRTQNAQGRWNEEYFTGTGFPNHFMIRYHLYRDCFPLMALGMYLRTIEATS
jgi:squalene-hopene/tetraprenyl-beta-curcumene cyclase